MTTTTLPSFAHITISEIAELMKHDAPASVLAIWSVLASFDYKKRGTCFPKISTIKKLLESTGGTFREGKIYWALSWLEEKGFLVRNERRSRKRFEMKLRQKCIAKSLTSDGSEYEADLPPTHQSRRENLRNRELTPPLTPPQEERKKPRRSRQSRRQRMAEIDAKLEHSKQLSTYCNEVAGYLMIRDNPDWKHLDNPEPTTGKCFTLEELKTELENPSILSYSHVGRQKIWSWIKTKHRF